MFIRPLPMVLALVLLSCPVAAQRTDILTDEPVRPPSAHPRPEPEILNAPHAPRQTPGRTGDSPPLEIYVAPQIGAGTGYHGNSGTGRLSQERRY